MQIVTNNVQGGSQKRLGSLETKKGNGEALCARQWGVRNVACKICTLKVFEMLHGVRWSIHCMAGRLTVMLNVLLIEPYRKEFWKETYY